ncbi:MAG TPA: hypothetical protein VLY21_05040 [Nitrososphaerales archaeon]|nr:hypothetical protein [Nitrososphaerales archaeon]
MKLRLEHALPRRLRYAKVYFEAGAASLSFSMDGSTANWRASIGRRRADQLELSDREYARFRASTPAVEMLDDDGEVVVVRNADGYEERWKRPQWVLMGLRKSRHGENVPTAGP